MVRPIISPPVSPAPPTQMTRTDAVESQVSPAVEAGVIDNTLAPTAEQVQEYAPGALVVESTGQTQGSEWVRLRDSANNQSIANYASRGSGINTGRYRNFNTLL